MKLTAAHGGLLFNGKVRLKHREAEPTAMKTQQEIQTSHLNFSMGWLHSASLPATLQSLF